MPLSRADLPPDAVDAARWLLGKRLARGAVAVEITEVEAYLGVDDPASHAWRGPTPRNRVMFGPPGHLYCYTMHGHTCCNVVSGPEGIAHAVLIRAGRVAEGEAEARSRRGDVDAWKLARGPGNLTRALGVTMADAGVDLFNPSSPVRLTPGREVPDVDVVAGPRVGVSRAADEPYRLWIAAERSVSAYRRSPRAGAAGF